MLRFTPPLPDLQKRIASGELGDAIAARAAVFGWEPSNDWFYDPKHGGGVILDTLVHFGDLVLWLFGPAAQVYTQGGAYVLDGARRYNSPDNATVTVTHTSGVVSSMYVSWTTGLRKLLPGRVRHRPAVPPSTSSTAKARRSS